jgi:enamine deaminase RidA (YjgF/YER057c/UK114 family)
LIATAALVALVGCAPKQEAAPPAEVVHHATGDFPIASAVEVPPGHTLVFLSGTTPSPAKPDAPQGSPEYWGNTEAQSLSVFNKIKETLAGLGLTFGDVVSMTVYLVADKSPTGTGRMDFQGMMAAYTQFFGAAANQPNLPSRSTVEVANLVQPGMLVEIEVTAVKPAK